MKVLVICGPTAVGKTNISIQMAKTFNGEIINVDSMQVYKEMNIGTAKVKESEMDDIKHHLFDIKSLDDDYSVADYQNDAREKINEITKSGKLPILVGGTGLYIKSALYDYQFPKRDTYNYEELSNEELFNLIKERGLIYKEHINNRPRMINLLSRGKTINDSKLIYDPIFIGLTMDRDSLYARIDQRVDMMFDQGLEAEVKLLKKKYPDSRALNTAIGYKEFNGDDLDLIKEQIKKDTRHYAKRQLTWFNNQIPVTWFDVNEKEVINNIIKYIKNRV